MAQNLTYFAEALKIDYLPVIREQLNNSSAFLTTVQRNEKDVSGSRWQLTAHYQRNSGVGAGDETTLPTAGQQKYKNPYGNVKYNRGRIEVSGPVMEASRDDKGAIVRALDAEIQGVTRDLKKEINFQLMNDGTSVRALVNGDPSTGTTLTVDTPGTNYLYDGIIVDVVDATTGAVEDEDVTLSTVNSTTACTASAALDANIEDNSKVVRANSTDGAGTSYEMMGIKGIADDGTYVVTLHNLSRDSYAWWKCSTFSTDSNAGTNRDMDLDLIQAAITAVEKNGGKTSMIISDHDMRDAYAALVVADKRFVNTLNLDGGFKALEYNGIPWVAEIDCQPNTVFFLDMEHLFLMQMGDWKWMDRDGAVLSRVSGKDAYEAAIVWYADLATDRPKAHSFLRDVQ
ncbi:MAG: phage major capsid protein [Candidatus Izemoplasmatales bacterium]